MIDPLIIVPEDANDDFVPPGYVQPEADEVYIEEVHTEHEGLVDPDE